MGRPMARHLIAKGFAVDRAVEALKCAIDNGLVSAMNTFNPEDVRDEQT